MNSEYVLWGVPVLISEPSLNFLDGLWSMTNRFRRVRRLVIEVIIIMEYLCIVRDSSGYHGSGVSLHCWRVASIKKSVSRLHV